MDSLMGSQSWSKWNMCVYEHLCSAVEGTQITGTNTNFLFCYNMYVYIKVSTKGSCYNSATKV